MRTLKLSVFFILLLFSQSWSSEAKLWSWFALEPAAAAAQSDPPLREPQCSSSRPTDLAKFDIESGSFLSNSRGKDLVEKARHQTAKHSCWHEAYTGLLSSCREILKEEEKKARLAMRLTNCFLQVSGRAPQHCSDSVPISKCTSGLTDHTNSIFLAFFIDAASMCHHLQSEAFKQETENVVNELKGSAHWVEAKLKDMESHTNIILQQTDDVISEQKVLHVKLQEHSEELMHEYQRLHSEMRERIKEGLSGLSSETEEVHKQLQGVASLQKEMSDHQHTLAESLSLEFEILQEKTYKIADSLTQEFSSLHKKSHEIADSLSKEFSSLHEKSHEIKDSLTTEFSSLHEKTHGIGTNVQRSLTGQDALLASQGQAMEGLYGLKKLQEDALEESRASVQELTREAKMHQQEFLAWQAELHAMQHQLAAGSNAMLAAQETFVSKQAAVFTSLERLFSLHNTILMESRALKTFLFYATTSIFVYLSTSAKQTYNARALLYCGLIITFAVELWLLRYKMSGGLHQTFSSLIFPRFTFGATAVSLLLYNILSYRDYTALSYEILVDLQQRMTALPLGAPFGHEEVCQQSSAPQSKITRITTPYEKSLTRKIVRRARACRSKFLEQTPLDVTSDGVLTGRPHNWLIPRWNSCGGSEEKEAPLPASVGSYHDAQAHTDDEVKDPGQRRTRDLTSPATTPVHSYNLRPRRSRLSPASVSSLKWDSVDAFTEAGTHN